MSLVIATAGEILAVAAKGQWWEILAALATPAIAVCTWVSRQGAKITRHLEDQDIRQREHGERLSRLEGSAGMNPHSVHTEQVTDKR